MPVRLNGSTSGYAELKAPAVAGSTSLTLPTDSIQPGLVLVNETAFSAVSSVSVNNCFSATYANYLIVLGAISSGPSQNLQWRARNGGTDVATAFEYYTLRNYTSDSAGPTRIALSSDLTNLGGIGESYMGYTINVFQPFSSSTKTALFTNVVNRSSANAELEIGSSVRATAASQDGFTVFTSGYNISGTLRVYAYRNSITA